MVRPPSFDTNGIKSGVWSKEEDDKLRAFVQKNGHHNWQKLPFLAGLARSGKSCRLRWVNYLQPGLKKGNFSQEEVDLIIRMHNQIGKKWSAIAEKLPGRTDNDIKNHWHAHISKRAKRGRFVSTAETGQEEEEEEESFEIIMNCEHEEETPAFDYSNVEALWAEACEESGFNDLDSSDGGISYDDHTQLNIEFFDFGLGYNDTPTFSDSSHTQITYDHHTYFTPPLILEVEEELYDFGRLCNNDTPTFIILDQ